MEDTVIFHCDADAFFAACHIAQDPTLAGLPLVVAGDPDARHGIVLTASYPARKYGIYTTMPLGKALKLCPSLKVLPPDSALYGRVSKAMRAVFSRFSPLVEPLSIDEAWLDMTGGWHLFGRSPREAATALQTAIWEESRVTASIGISSNKMLAKQVSDWNKPAGITEVWPQDVPEQLWPRPIRDLYGIGPRLAERLSNLGVTTIGDLASKGTGWVEQYFGAGGAGLLDRAHGRELTPVHLPTGDDVQSVGAETTLPRDISGFREAAPVLLGLSDHVASRLRRAGKLGDTVALKYKTNQFVSHTHQMKLPAPTCYTTHIYEASCTLFRSRAHVDPVRLLGVQVAGLGAGTAQLQLWEEDRQASLAGALDTIRERFGQGAILPATLMGQKVRHGGSSFEKPWRYGDPTAKTEDDDPHKSR